MEDVLEVYHRRFEDNEVLVCLDETSKQLVQETRQPLPLRPGAAMAYDYEYQRNGVSNLFMLFAPLEGWRRVEVTERRTRTGWAGVVRKLVDEDYPEKDRIVLVMDNLNTHHPSSLYGAFEPGEARRIAERLEITLHTQARKLAEHGGERVGGAGRAVPGPPDSRPRRPETRNPGLARATKPRRSTCRLAFHHRRRPHQAQVLIPINTTVVFH